MVHYRWHPQFGTTIQIAYREHRRGEDVAVIETPSRSRAVLPTWMLDAGVCAAMTLGPPRVAFAREHFGAAAEFTEQSITDLSLYGTGAFDVTISSEVLEHLKEYGKEDVALSELRRITRPGGIVLVLIATPDTEMVKDHGFSFEEMSQLMGRHFKEHLVFENALVPFGKARRSWDARLAAGRVGAIVSEAIRFDETVLPNDATPETKTGEAPGRRVLGPLSIDTTLLHNTHSWIAIGINDPPHA